MKQQQLYILFIFYLLNNLIFVEGQINYYFDSVNGNDSNNGTSPEFAFQTLRKVPIPPVPGSQILFARGSQFRGYLFPKSGNITHPVIYDAYGYGPKPQIIGSIQVANASLWTLSDLPNVWQINLNQFNNTQTTITVVNDVGNLIFNDYESFGYKNTSSASITTPGFYYYNASTGILNLNCVENPGTFYKSIEVTIGMASSLHLVYILNAKYIIVRNLNIKNAGGHCMSIMTSYNITIENNDLEWCGGQGNSVRLGNGIEMYNQVENITIQNNFIQQAYDTATTIQGGQSGNIAKNIVFYNNLMMYSTQCYEMWYSNAAATITGVRFQQNTCLFHGSPKGWQYNQRQKGQGDDLLFYKCSGQVLDIVFQQNIFYGAQDSIFWMGTPYPGNEEFTFIDNILYPSQLNSGTRVYGNIWTGVSNLTFKLFSNFTDYFVDNSGNQNLNCSFNIQSLPYPTLPNDSPCKGSGFTFIPDPNLTSPPTPSPSSSDSNNNSEISNSNTPYKFSPLNHLLTTTFFIIFLLL